MRVGIIGAGISGLSLAYYLQKMGIPYDLFEASSEVGGNIKTRQVDKYTLELGPNSLELCEELKGLISDLKLEREVQHTNPKSKDRYVLRNGFHHKLPSSAFSFLSNTFFPWKTKLRILQERDIPPATVSNETISQFFERRFGPEVVDYAVNPFVTGIYAGDPDKLLIEKAFPKLKEMENKYGSVLKGLVKQKRSVHRQETISFKEGMQTLPNAIAEKLISLHLEHRIEFITRCNGKYIISSAIPGDHDAEEYDIIVMALPAHKAADMLQYTYPGLSAALQNINYPPMAVVHTVYNSTDMGHQLNGFGALHPRVEKPFAAGSIWTSSVFEGRCRPQEVMFTTFVGGAQYPEHALTKEQELLQRVHEELCTQYDIKAEAPVFQQAHVWQQSIPQYDLYIEDTHQLLKTFEEEGLFVAANWQAGVSVPRCIQHAKELAYKINLQSPLALNS